jgi:hypothetical protein
VCVREKKENECDDDKYDSNSNSIRDDYGRGIEVERMCHPSQKQTNSNQYNEKK